MKKPAPMTACLTDWLYAVRSEENGSKLKSQISSIVLKIVERTTIIEKTTPQRRQLRTAEGIDPAGNLAPCESAANTSNANLATATNTARAQQPRRSQKSGCDVIGAHSREGEDPYFVATCLEKVHAG